MKYISTTQLNRDLKSSAPLKFPKKSMLTKIFEMQQKSFAKHKSIDKTRSNGVGRKNGHLMRDKNCKGESGFIGRNHELKRIISEMKNKYAKHTD